MNEPRTPDLQLRRFRCWLLSCDGSPYCERCGTDLYDPDYIQYGKLDWLLRLYWRVYEWTQRPKYCGKPIGNCFDSRCTLRKNHDGECDDIPF
jgi:hypothetical protein